MVKPKGAHKSSGSPDAISLQAKAAPGIEYGGHCENQPDCLAEHSGCKPVIRKNQKSNTINRLQVKYTNFGRITPVWADNAMLLIQQICQNHFAAHIAVDIGASM